MLLDFHPDIPGLKYDKPYKFLGYWHAVGIDLESNLPMPPSSAFQEAQFHRYEATCGAFVLPFPCDYVNKMWAASERESVLTYLKATTEVFESWRGNSWCRFRECDGKYIAGYRDFTDGIYVWPEAFPHYIEKHLVKPPDEFVAHVLRRSR